MLITIMKHDIIVYCEVRRPEFLPVLEQSKSLMSPNPDQTIHVQVVQRPECLTDSPDPPRHLAGAVHIVGLHVLCESLLQ